MLAGAKGVMLTGVREVMSDEAQEFMIAGARGVTHPGGWH